MTPKQKENILKAGKIAKQIKEWIKPQIKKGIPLIEIAEKIEDKIIELGGKPAFPTNLSINEIAAHYTPSYNDETHANGLLKVDLGVQVGGWIADTAFSLDLENNEGNKKLIEASKEALKNAIKKIEEKNSLGEIGKTIQETIESKGFSPVINLTGHEMNEYELHSGLTIFNIKNSKIEKLGKGLYAVEPFATNGSGKVHDGKPSGIYILVNERNIRSPEARKILNFIIEEYKTLPFCSRWLVKKFGTKSLFALRQLEDNENLHQYPQLVDSAGSKISQAENTILIDDEIIVTSE
ncbi:type II methionyl aminopeptidase [Candidatus Pacearchaeota archaeon RBG_19FT_COMBO_34_9]|nr:MAG: type II methionyl aminopeptidase [Candidatus Pacearchaeota archaeon RBG_19FT_COMBO_34_9]OGJ17014.1 MAG: type II methionyl aminopeptidase [Candidatus Pacearchaeota archaeon RBG_13_33_26]